MHFMKEIWQRVWKWLICRSELYLIKCHIHSDPFPSLPAPFPTASTWQQESLWASAGWGRGRGQAGERTGSGGAPDSRRLRVPWRGGAAPTLSHSLEVWGCFPRLKCSQQTTVTQGLIPSHDSLFNNVSGQETYFKAKEVRQGPRSWDSPLAAYPVPQKELVRQGRERAKAGPRQVPAGGNTGWSAAALWPRE